MTHDLFGQPGSTTKAKAICRKTDRHIMRRVKSESNLSEILPPRLEMGHSYHVISHGDVDALSYLIHINRHTVLETLTISSWCMAMTDIDWLKSQQQAGKIGHIHFILGEIFPSQYPDEYTALANMDKAGDCTLKIARNHAKVMAGANPEQGIWFAIESSSNINTNPRIEQTAIHMSQDLHDFYVDFYAGIKSIDGNRYERRSA